MPTDAPRSVKGKRVETLRQAQTFDYNKNHYVKLGLCSPCAAQAAWGHQLGFSKSKPPCQECRPLVACFPVKEASNWRSLSPRHGAKLPRQLRLGTGH